MEIAKNEILVIEGAQRKLDDEALSTLSDHQLTMIGGGIGDVVVG